VPDIPHPAFGTYRKTGAERGPVKTASLTIFT